MKKSIYFFIVFLLLLQSCAGKPVGENLAESSVQEPTKTNLPISYEEKEKILNNYKIMIYIYFDANMLYETASRVDSGELVGIETFGSVIVLASIVNALDSAINLSTTPVSLEKYWNESLNIHNSTKNILSEWYNEEIDSAIVMKKGETDCKLMEKTITNFEMDISKRYGFSATEMKKFREDTLIEFNNILESPLENGEIIQTEPVKTQEPEQPKTTISEPSREASAESVTIEDDKPNVFNIKKWIGAGLVHFKYEGSSNFVVDALDANNESTAWGLVNSIGKYEGWAIIDAGGDTQSTRLEVSLASGPYTITIYPLSPDFTSSVNVPGSFSGEIPNVIYLNGDNPDFIKFLYSGDSNFIVDAVDLNGNSTSWGLVNAIGAFEGIKIIPNDSAYIYISHASGPYTIEITAR